MKRFVRRFILASSVPPLAAGYRGVYRLTAAAVGRRLARHPDAEAVYLARGGGRGEVLPGISDLDFRVVLRDGSQAADGLRRDYERLARRLPILDPGLEVYTESELRLHHQQSTFHQYRFAEGKRHWRLLHGRDAVAELPDVSPADLSSGLYTEIKVWWSQYARRFFQPSVYADDPVQGRSLCYKAAAEILKCAAAIEEGAPLVSRAETLRLGRERAPREAGPILALEQTAASRFLRGEKGLEDRTTAFLIRRLDGFYAQLQRLPFAQNAPGAPPNARQRLDHERAEWIAGDALEAHAAGLFELAQGWGDRCLGACLVPSFSFNVDALALMIQVDPVRVPTNNQLLALVRAHREWSGPRELLLYIRTPHAAFQLDGENATSAWQSMLCPVSNPDVFELAAQPELTLLGEPAPNPGQSVWPPFLEHFFRDEERLFYELIDSPGVYKLKALEFCRVFWKTAQLVCGLKSAEQGEPRHPLTVPAITRALAEAGRPLPENLEDLISGYSEALSGSPVDLGRLYPAAVRYLQEIRE